MPSIVRTTQSHKSTQKFRTVLGVFKDQDHTPAAATLGRGSRQSIDTPRSYTGRRKHRVDPSHSSVTEISFFQADRTTVPTDQPPVIDLASYDMDIPRTQSAHRRPPVRMDAQDGPWSVSVAETPHDSRAYSLYIKSKHLSIYLLSFCDRGHFICGWCTRRINFLGHRTNVSSCLTSTNPQSYPHPYRHGNRRSSPKAQRVSPWCQTTSSSSGCRRPPHSPSEAQVHVP